MQVTDPKTRRWTRAEYYRMAEMGLFEGQRVELIDGEIVEMTPQRNAHAVAIGEGEDVLRVIFPRPRYWVRVQLPLILPSRSEPEPDLAVVAGSPRTHREHPSTALLVVEVSDTTLQFDRGRKASLYASAGIEDYWIVNLLDRRLEVQRRPVADSAAPFGWRYDDCRVLAPGERIAPLAAPGAGAMVEVGELLP